MTIPPVQPRAGAGAVRITPTDVSQFVRYEECERFLRFQLHSRNENYNFMRERKLHQQTLSPILSGSGAEFEDRLEAALNAPFQSEGGVSSAQNRPKKFASRADSGDRRRNPDNEEVIQIARGLQPGEARWLLQPRLVVDLHGWQMRGDADILRLRRSGAGALQVLVADMKASPQPKIDQKLQVAFYHEMLAQLFLDAGLAHEPIECGIYYRGPLDLDAVTDIDARRILEEHKAAALREFGPLLPEAGTPEHAYFDAMPDLDSFLLSAHAMVFDSNSAAEKAALKTFGDLDWHLSYKCDGCPFSEWCFQNANASDDLSLLPHMDADLKSALRARGVHTVTQLAAVKTLKPHDEIKAAVLSDAQQAQGAADGAAPVYEDEHLEPDSQAWNELETSPAHQVLAAQLSGTRGLGARLDEMILRSHALVKKRGGEFAQIRTLKKLSRRGHPSLPYSSAEVNPSLVTLIIDAQYDFLQGRLYSIGSLVVAHEGGVAKPARTVLHLTDGPPKTSEDERNLLQNWLRDTLAAVLEAASPTAEGKLEAPLHLVFFDASEQRGLGEALGRHFDGIAEARPVFDFFTQIGSFDSSLHSFLDQEMRERHNYPLTCPSLYEVSSWLRFDWGNLRRTFRTRIFDGGGYIERESDDKEWQQKRARYASSIPLEYAYAAWGHAPAIPAKGEGEDEWEGFRHVTREEWLAFAQRRLEAIRHVADDFEGNKLTTKTPLDLSILGQEPRTALTLADALEEFLMLERHAELGTWKAARNAPPERRALAGDSLVCKYLEAEQSHETLDQWRRNALIEAKKQQWREDNPTKKRVPNGFVAGLGLGDSSEEVTLRLRLENVRSGVSVQDMIALSGFSQGQRVILAERYSIDSRLPEAERRPFQTTAKQILYGMRGDLVQIEPSDDGQSLWLHVQLSAKGGGSDGKGFVFSGRITPPVDGKLFSIEEEINNHVGSNSLKTLQMMHEQGAKNTLLERLQHPQDAQIPHSKIREDEQKLFMAGLQVLAQRDPKLKMEAAKQKFIAQHGDPPFLLVQGPPGTGKTYATSWALMSRLQAALRDGSALRILVSCKTHAAIDVLMRGLRRAQQRLEEAHQQEPEVFAQYFDERLLSLPLLRFQPKEPALWKQDAANEGLQMLLDKNTRGEHQPEQERADKYLQQHDYCVLGATPNACYKLAAQANADKEALFDNEWFGMLVVDEASQMSLPEAVMAALPLHPSAPIVVVGDPRQMPPIVSHDWRNETRRTFTSFKAFASLYDAVAALDIAHQAAEHIQGVTRESQSQVLDDLHGTQAMAGVALEDVARFELTRIAFEESFRLHRDMAEFLRREIYQKDGIFYHSNITQVLEAPQIPFADDLVRAALDPDYPLVVIVHEESSSVLSNEFEQKLSEPILRALAGEEGHALDARSGLGVVVPHRAQRALMRDDAWNVDTVERFQGDEREAMLFCATESERGHILRAGGFLFDPRRLNVALSRAKKKMILVASSQVFNSFFADEETFANAMLWKNLLRHTCNVSLHRGELDGVKYEVRGNNAAAKSV